MVGEKFRNNFKEVAVAEISNRECQSNKQPRSGFRSCQAYDRVSIELRRRQIAVHALLIAGRELLTTNKIPRINSNLRQST